MADQNQGTTIADPETQYLPSSQDMSSQKPIEKPGELKEELRLKKWEERTKKKDVYMEMKEALTNKYGKDREAEKKRAEERQKAEDENIEIRRTAIKPPEEEKPKQEAKPAWTSSMNDRDEKELDEDGKPKSSLPKRPLGRPDHKK